MGYHHLDPEDIEPTPDRPCETHYISKALEMENIGLRVYRVRPGEEIPLTGLHYHDRQEEAFYVLEGQLHVETPDREYVIKHGELFVAEPESPHRAFNATEATGDAKVLAVGAPPVSDGHAYEG